MTTDPVPPCPSCGAAAVIPIAYGYPTFETSQAAERGEVVLGGCLYSRGSPRYVCRSCRLPLPWRRALSFDAD